MIYNRLRRAKSIPPPSPDFAINYLNKNETPKVDKIFDEDSNGDLKIDLGHVLRGHLKFNFMFLMETPILALGLR